MRLFPELQYTVIIEFARSFYQMSVSAKFSKVSKTYFLSYRRDKFVKTVMQPRHPPGTSLATIVTISWNHRDSEYLLHHIARKLGSTATSTVITGLLPSTDYIAGAENETLQALSGHTNGNIDTRSPSAAGGGGGGDLIELTILVEYIRLHICILPVYHWLTGCIRHLTRILVSPYVGLVWISQGRVSWTSQNSVRVRILVTVSANIVQQEHKPRNLVISLRSR